TYKRGVIMIELKNVSKFYTNNGVVTLGLRNINLKLNVGEIVAITGDSGSGKSTLLNVITAVDTYEEGEIYFEGNETSYFNQNDMDMFRKNHVSFIFQNYNIIDSYTVLENVMLPLLLRGKSQEESKTEAKEIIEKVGLSKRIHHRGTKLSGGEKQRCVIARALASDSKILACDEPTGNLDSQTGDEIIKLIAEVAKDKLVLIVTHNYNQISSIATRRIKVSDGEIIEDVYLKENTEEEEPKEFVLEDKKVKKSTFFRVALQNIFSTPKKTIFSTIVFMVISFITLLLCLMMLEQSHDTYYDHNYNYDLKTNDRLIVYDKDHKGLNKEVLEGVDAKGIYYNAFYEETNMYLLAKIGEDTKSIEVKLTYKKLNYDLFTGRDAEQDGEYVYVMPENAYYWYLESVLSEDGRDFDVIVNGEYVRGGRIVGFATTKENIDSPYLQCYSNFSESILDAAVSFYKYNYYYYIDSSDVRYTLGREEVDSDESYIICPKSFENENFNFVCLLNDLYEVPWDLEVRYEDRISAILCLGRKQLSFKDLEKMEIYEASIYTDSISSVKEKLEAAGYRVSVPSEMRVKASMLNLILLYSFLALTIMALVCLFFISYVILARVYASKNKDYGVLRTLGMVKKQLGRIVILEVIGIGLIASIFSLILFIILYHTTPAFSMGKYMGFGILCLYFVLMLLFSYFIARRFNRRLYKFSVNTTVKGEVARND
ncbi:MAG: ABC transporter ATP-binding protein/permease, partial [Anaeroplasmataceae bacterium]|nr:ABC transporter ATP-binding protein/permease [Anaeroplasmataceae bacterium]